MWNPMSVEHGSIVGSYDAGCLAMKPVIQLIILQRIVTGDMPLDTGTKSNLAPSCSHSGLPCPLYSHHTTEKRAIPSLYDSTLKDPSHPFRPLPRNGRHLSFDLVLPLVHSISLLRHQKSRAQDPVVVKKLHDGCIRPFPVGILVPDLRHEQGLEVCRCERGYVVRGFDESGYWGGKCITRGRWEDEGGEGVRVCLGEKHGKGEAGSRDSSEEDLAVDAVEIPGHWKGLRGEKLNVRAGHIEFQDFDSHATSIGRVCKEANDPVPLDQNFLGLSWNICLDDCDVVAFSVVRCP